MVVTWYEDDSLHSSLFRCSQLNEGSAPGCRQGCEKGQQTGVQGSPSAPRCGGTSKASASDMGIVQKDGSGVAVDVVTGRSCSHEGEGPVCSQAYVRAARIMERKRVSSSVAARDRGY